MWILGTNGQNRQENTICSTRAKPQSLAVEYPQAYPHSIHSCTHKGSLGHRLLVVSTRLYTPPQVVVDIESPRGILSSWPIRDSLLTEGGTPGCTGGDPQCRQNKRRQKAECRNQNSEVPGEEAITTDGHGWIQTERGRPCAVSPDTLSLDPLVPRTLPRYESLPWSRNVPVRIGQAVSRSRLPRSTGHPGDDERRYLRGAFGQGQIGRAHV